MRIGASVGEKSPGLEDAEGVLLAGFVVEGSIVYRDHVWRAVVPKQTDCRLSANDIHLIDRNNDPGVIIECAQVYGGGDDVFVVWLWLWWCRRGTQW